MGWGQRHRPNPAAERARLIRTGERNARLAQAAIRFAAADLELTAAEASWPDAMTRTALLDVDQADIAAIQERCRVAMVEWRAAKSSLITETNTSGTPASNHNPKEHQP